MVSSVEEIQEQREAFEEAKFQTEAVYVNGFEYPYYVIDEDWKRLPKGLPKLFAFQMTESLKVLETNPPPFHTLFGVSKAISRASRPLVAMHEVVEYVDLVLETAHKCRCTAQKIPDRPESACKRASEVELRELFKTNDPAFIWEHINMRLTFFSDQIAYRKAQHLPNDSLLVQMQASLGLWVMRKEVMVQTAASLM